MDIREKTVAQVVAENYKTAAVFKKNGIDFCCGGKIAVAEACRKKNINVDNFIQVLKEVMQEAVQKDAADWLSPGKLVDYIVDVHHSYVHRRIPEIEPFLEKVARVHGDRRPELIKTRNLFNDIKNELLSHMLEEENKLFAHIKALAASKEQKKQLAVPAGSIKEQVQGLEEAHGLIGENFKEIRKITDDLTPPEDACNTYRVTFAMLAEFEDDLQRHIHLENNVLFPKAITLEEGLSNAH